MAKRQSRAAEPKAPAPKVASTDQEVTATADSGAANESGSPKASARTKSDAPAAPTPTQQELDAMREDKYRASVAGSAGTYETR